MSTLPDVGRTALQLGDEYSQFSVIHQFNMSGFKTPNQYCYMKCYQSSLGHYGLMFNGTATLGCGVAFYTGEQDAGHLVIKGTVIKYGVVMYGVGAAVTISETAILETTVAQTYIEAYGSEGTLVFVSSWSDVSFARADISIGALEPSYSFVCSRYYTSTMKPISRIFAFVMHLSLANR